MEQILIRKPDVILYDLDSIYETVKRKKAGSSKAIQDGKYMSAFWPI
jgi:hypothetical protein